MRPLRRPVHQRFMLYDLRLARPSERQPLGVRRLAGRRHGRRRSRGRGRGLQRSRAARAVRRRVRNGDAHVGRLLLL